MIVVDAGNLPRILSCTGSYVMQADPVFTERDNTVREEGNAAHWLALTAFSGQHTVQELVDRKAPNGVYITADMAEHVSDYLSAIGAGGQMEWGYTLNGQNYQINGRADHIRYDTQTGVLSVPDFKYGYTLVEPEMNWTLISHAIGYCIMNEIAPQQIVLTIHQPRASHPISRVREWSISCERLTQLFLTMSGTLNNPDNMLHTGSHCYKCPSFLGCPARQAANLNAIEVSHTAYYANISDADLAFTLDQINRAEKLLEQSKKAYQEQALHRICNGRVIDNYSVDDDLANRSWKPSVTAEMMQVLTGKNLAKKDLITPRQAEQLGVSEDIVNAFTERKLKGKRLVRVSANAKAKKMFGDK